MLTAEAMRDIAHLFRAEHLEQLAAILEDPEASDNDRFVAVELKKRQHSGGRRLPVARTQVLQLSGALRRRS